MMARNRGIECKFSPAQIEDCLSWSWPRNAWWPSGRSPGCSCERCRNRIWSVVLEKEWSRLGLCHFEPNTGTLNTIGQHSKTICDLIRRNHRLAKVALLSPEAARPQVSTKPRHLFPRDNVSQDKAGHSKVSREFFRLKNQFFSRQQLPARN